MTASDARPEVAALGQHEGGGTADTASLDAPSPSARVGLVALLAFYP